MDENKLTEKLDTLQAQNIALMYALATLQHSMPLDRQLMRNGYDGYCATFQAMILEQRAPDELQIQRAEFQRIGKIVFGAE